MPSKAQRKGYESNQLARHFLFSSGYEWIWFKAHQRHQDTVFLNKKGEKLACTDIFGLFDGIAFKQIGRGKAKIYVPVFLQIKTNSWRGWNAIREFCKNRAISVLFMNVQNGKVKVRSL